MTPLDEVAEAIVAARHKTYSEDQERARITLATHYAPLMVADIECCVKLLTACWREFLLLSDILSSRDFERVDSLMAEIESILPSEATETQDETGSNCNP